MQYLAEPDESPGITQVALDNFAALLDDADFTAEMELMGVGRFQFLRRRQMDLELRGLHMALWRLALSRSFPNDADAMFATFLHGYLSRHPQKGARQAAERARQYWGMLEPTGDADFNEVARHLTSFAERDEKEQRTLTLRLALHIRKVYCFIFDRLI